MILSIVGSLLVHIGSRTDQDRLQELMAITDEHVDNTLRSQDSAQGKWLNEDPSLTQIQQMLMRR
jgi:hypothetical protein